MTDSDLIRRTILQSAAGLGLASAATGTEAATKSPSLGGDFGFLAGEWRISNRRLKTPGTDDWDVYPGEATVTPALKGNASIEELRIPARKFSGMGIRLYRPATKEWADHWVNSMNGELGEPMMGTFTDGVGTFLANDTEDGKPVIYRGVWDKVTPTSCRWRQGSSKDGGKTWADTWFMDWVRA
jgi:hypothetical protein